jgi:hypothetical protein
MNICTHTMKKKCVLNLILTNEKEIVANYSKYEKKYKFLLIQRILKRLKNESAILLINHNIVKNSKIKNFDNLKKTSKIPCNYCGKLFQTNFELAKHIRSNQCVNYDEPTCSFCLHDNTSTHKNRAHRPVECVLCGALIKGLIFH